MLLGLAAALALTGCATRVPDGSSGGVISASAWASASSDPDSSAAWTHQTFPGKRASHYHPQRKDGRDAIMVRAQSSASMVRKRTRVEPAQLGQLRFSWLVPAVIEAADMSRADREDSPVRLVLAFDGDRGKFSAKDNMMSELAEALTGEAMPYATLMYVWSNHLPAESVITNPRTSRIRKVVLESGSAKLGQWQTYERDVCADFLKAFGEKPGVLVSVGIMTDTDNTRSDARAWYGPVRQQVGGGGGC